MSFDPYGFEKEERDASRRFYKGPDTDRPDPSEYQESEMLELDWDTLSEAISDLFGVALMELAAEREEPEEDLIIEFIRQGLNG